VRWEKKTSGNQGSGAAGFRIKGGVRVRGGGAPFSSEEYR
jgi:hypothetical protein